MSNYAERLCSFLASFTYQWSTEIELQEAIWDVLNAGRLGEFPLLNREYRLSPQDRPDFLVTAADGTTIAVEVKVKGSRNAVMRQLGRYAAHAEVDAVVLASSRRVLAAAMPHSIHGKPVLTVVLESAL